MGSSDLQIVFPVFIFVVLVCILGAFFTITTDNELALKNPDSDINLPYVEGTLVNETTDGGTPLNPTQKPGDWVQIISGLLLSGIAIGLTILFPPAGIFTIPGLIASATIVYGGLTTIEGIFGDSAINSIPIVGNIVQGINYVQTSITSFVGLITWGKISFGGIPVLMIIIGIPLGFLFFVFLIRFIRGQG